jgi:hypothetical protein
LFSSLSLTIHLFLWKEEEEEKKKYFFVSARNLFSSSSSSSSATHKLRHTHTHKNNLPFQSSSSLGALCDPTVHLSVVGRPKSRAPRKEKKRRSGRIRRNAGRK